MRIVLIIGILINLARAEMCAIDPSPAATLLAPYFSVDTAYCNSDVGEGTIIYLTNAQASATIAHVTLWTDFSVPTYSFDLSLTGFDVQQIDLKSLICFGKVTSNSSPIVSPAVIDHFKSWHKGEISTLSGNCAGSSRNNELAIGYVTIDNMIDFAGAALNPSSGASYFSKTSVVNQLLAHVYHLTYETVDELIVKPLELDIPPLQKCKKKNTEKKRIACKARNKAIKQLTPLLTNHISVESNQVIKSRGLKGYQTVSINADPSFNSSSSPSGATFYGRYVANGADHREPLPSEFSVQYGNSDLDLIIWREGTPSASPVNCGSIPAGYPLTQNSVFAFDEQENPAQIFPLIPFETQVLDGFSDALPFSSGWVWFDLNKGSAKKQAWIVKRYDGAYHAAGTYDSCDAP